MKISYRIALALLCLAWVLGSCALPPDQRVDIGSDGTLIIKQWTSKGGVYFTRYFDREMGVVCYYYSGSLSCVKP